MFAKPEATIGADVASCMIDVRAIIAEADNAVNRPCKAEILAVDPANPAKEVMTALAKDIMAEPAVVIALGKVPMLELKELKAAGKACIATLATCADVAISLSPVPACCNPGPAEAIPEPAIAVKPVATAAKVPTKSPSFRSTNILIP